MMMFLGMICGEEDIINLISDDDDIVPVATVREGKSKIRTPQDDIPQVAVHKGKGKTLAPSVGEVIELSDRMLGPIVGMVHQPAKLNHPYL
jgi:hypothetical protein